MTESERKYKKERSRHVAVNLTLKDYNRWQTAADLTGQPLATFIRKEVENRITEIEDSYEASVEDILKCQINIKEG